MRGSKAKLAKLRAKDSSKVGDRDRAACVLEHDDGSSGESRGLGLLLTNSRFTENRFIVNTHLQFLKQ